MGASNGWAFLLLFHGTRVGWADNLFVPESRWGDGVGVGYWDWGTQPGVIIGADITWHGIVPALPDNLPRSPPENARTTARRVCDARLRENRLVRAQNFFCNHPIGGDELVNWSDDDWEYLWDELADQ